mgnify:CR=1 FL=1
MRLAVISDIHGNLEALKAVLRDSRRRKAESIACLGDIVGYYPDPEKCVRLMRKRASISVAGNNDYAAIGRIETLQFNLMAQIAISWTAERLSDQSREYLGGLPFGVEKDGVFFTHSSPSDPQDWLTYVFPDSEQTVFEVFSNLTQRLNFIGHTHAPSIMIQDGDRILLHSESIVHLDPAKYYLVNVGSVGQPRDFDARASYAVYDSAAGSVEIVRVPYNYSRTRRKVRRRGLPQGLGDRLPKGR